MADATVIRAVVGAAIVLASAGGLIWNEWRGAGVADLLVDARRSVTTIAVDSAPASLEGRVVHLAGEATSDAELTDPLLGPARPVLRLDRIVELFQWKEIQEGGQNDRIVRYEGVWSTSLIDSRSYRDQGFANPRSFPVEPAVELAPQVRMGAYTMDPTLVRAVPAEPVTPLEPNARIGSVELRLFDRAYWSGDPSKPQVGDVRVSFAQVPRGLLSVVGISRDGRVEPLIDRNGRPAPLARIGLLGPHDLLGTAQAAEAGELWKGRAILTFAMFIGVMIASPTIFAVAPALLALGGGTTPGAGLVTTLLLAVAAIAAGWALFRVG